MFARWGSWVARFRWPVLIIAVVAVSAAGFSGRDAGIGAGYPDPAGGSVDSGTADLVAIYTPTGGSIDDPALGRRIRARLAALPPAAVTSHTSYWQRRSRAYAATDRSSAVALLTLAGSDYRGKLGAYRAVRNELAVPGAAVRLAGPVAVGAAADERIGRDLRTAGLIALPVLLLLMLLLVGSAGGGAVPVLLGAATVPGSVGALHGLDVPPFATAVALLLGTGMAMAYGQLVTVRFRAELTRGRTTAQAIRESIGTAGRTAVVSAVVLMSTLAGLLASRLEALTSVAYGGLATVGVAAVLSATLLPALLAILGRRVDALPVRRTREAVRPGGSLLAARRRGPLVAAAVLAGLIVLAAPLLGVHFGGTDDRILPDDDPARVAEATLTAGYPALTASTVPMVLRGTTGTAAFTAAARRVPGVARLGPVRGTRHGDVVVATLSTADPDSPTARAAVAGLRAIPLPTGAQLMVGGRTARDLDTLHSVAGRLPLLLGVPVGATVLVLMLAFGSALLPAVAVLTGVLALGATLGALVWTAQSGRGAALLHLTPAPLPVDLFLLVAILTIGLSAHGQIVHYARRAEARANGPTDHGPPGTAGVIPLIALAASAALSSVAPLRLFAVGVVIALVLDTAVVRLMLTPALVHLLGRATWWAPGPLRRAAGSWTGSSCDGGDQAPDERRIQSGHGAPPIPAGDEAPAIPAGDVRRTSPPTDPALSPDPAPSTTAAPSRDAGLDYAPFMQTIPSTDDAPWTPSADRTGPLPSAADGQQPPHRGDAGWLPSADRPAPSPAPGGRVEAAWKPHRRVPTGWPAPCRHRPRRFRTTPSTPARPRC